ncbi:hypothetical protein NHQ30_002215 [Ciborinia camelliae]|nr:hypothetical protein NHQ30_002215 [Ciborinia camelliae]
MPQPQLPIENVKGHVPAPKRANVQPRSNPGGPNTATRSTQSRRSQPAWSSNDELLLQRTTGPEELLWRRCLEIPNITPLAYELIPDGEYVDISINHQSASISIFQPQRIGPDNMVVPRVEGHKISKFLSLPV